MDKMILAWVVFEEERICKMTEKEYCNVADFFGENVFNDSVMQARLPKKVYKKLHEVMEEGRELDLETADVVAHEMKEWAIEKVRHTILTGSNRLQALQLKNMTLLLPHRWKTVRF